MNKDITLALLMATPEETEPFLKLCRSSHQVCSLPQGLKLDGLCSDSPTIWEFNYPNFNLAVILTGMGRERAALAAQLAVRRYQPQLLLSAGFAGALSPSLQIGQIVGVERLEGDLSTEPSEISKRIWERAKQSWEAQAEHVAANMPLPYKITSASVLTCSQVVRFKHTKAHLLSCYGAAAVDMEAASVAQVAIQEGVPWAAVKVVSDAAAFDMPMDFTSLTDPETGQVDKVKVIWEIFKRPGCLAGLKRLAQNSALAAQNLAKFLNGYIQTAAVELKS